MGIFRFVLRLIFFQIDYNLIMFQFIFSIYFNFISMLTELNWIEFFFFYVD